jgi:hypothetical protein
VTAGQPLHDVLKLRTIEVLRFEAVTEKNVAEVSSFVRVSSPSGRASGFLVEGIVKRQRDLAFPNLGRGDPIKDTPWADADGSAALKFFVAKNHPHAVEVFVPGKRVNIIVSQKAECDTHPPTGICVFDHPIRLVDPRTWAKYGE